jgi:hypothetical protein
VIDFSRCRDVWVPDESGAGGFWSPPPPHVRYGVEQIVEHPYFFLCDDMGGMKTAQACISAQFLHDSNIIDRVIVITPASIRSAVWFSEDFGQLREQIFEDKRNYVTEYHARVRSWSHGPEEAPELRWIISNFEYIRSKKNLAGLLPYCGPKTMLILDESSAVRTYDSAQTEACMLLRWKQNAKGRPILGAARCGRVLEMNGTPLAESPMDLFSQGNLLDPSILECRFVTLYKARYAIQEVVRGSGGQALLNPRTGKPLESVVGWTNLADLQKRFAPYVLRREAKDLGIDFALPPVGIDVPLTDPTWKIYQEMKREMVVWLKSGVATSSTAAVKMIRLAQITSGFLGGIEDPNTGDFEEQMIDITTFSDPVPKLISNIQVIGREKLDFALEWQSDLLRRYPNMKLLTWCRFVPELRRYMAEVQKFSHTFTPGILLPSTCSICGAGRSFHLAPDNVVGAASGASIFGEPVKKEREAALRLLHPKTAPIGPATVGATQGTGAIGLNFTACRTVLDMSYDFSPWKKKQGDARVNRPGQTGPVSFFYLVATGPRGQRTIDYHIMLTRLGKANVNDWTVAAWVKALTAE